VADTVTEVTASTGALVEVISGSAFEFNYPGAAVAADNDPYVAKTSSITEVNAASGERLSG
jgi:hypothetical protein